MSVQQTDSYLIICDFPDCTVDTGTLGEYGAYGSAGEAEEDWHEHEAYVGPLGTYCPTHTIVDPDPDPDSDEDQEGWPYRPMIPTIENLFVLADSRIRTRIERAELEARARLNERVRAWERRDASLYRRVDVRLSQLDHLIASQPLVAQIPIIVDAFQQAYESHPSFTRGR